MILIGLPASGKTTFYRERFAGTHDHVSKDLMRNTHHPERRQRQLIAESLGGGRSVVVDNTNATMAIRAALIGDARAHGARVIGYFFPTETADALGRNRSREGRERVPDVAIFTVRKRLQPPRREEGFDELYLVRVDEATRTFVISSA